MKKLKEEILKELIEHDKKLGKSPGRREIPYSLNKRCIKNFGSLNKAKEAARLKIYRRRCLPISKKSMKYTKELVRIVAYITGDGHLHKDLKGFLLSSQDIKSLKDFEFCVKKQFNIELSKIQQSDETSYGEAIQYRYFNTTIAKFLYLIGAPKGDKVITKFDVPKWIKNNKIFMKEYIKILFYCEGSKSKENKIRFAMSKANIILEDGQKFMNSLINGLNELEIKTTKLWLTKAKRRNRDNLETTYMSFQLRQAFVDKFIKEIGWLK